MSCNWMNYKKPLFYVSISQIVIWGLLFAILNHPPQSQGNTSTNQNRIIFPDNSNNLAGISVRQQDSDNHSLNIYIDNVSFEADSLNGLASGAATTVLIDNFKMQIAVNKQPDKTSPVTEQKKTGNNQEIPLEELLNSLQEKVISNISQGNNFLTNNLREIAGNTSGVIIKGITLEYLSSNGEVMAGINARQLKASAGNKKLAIQGMVTIYKKGKTLYCSKCEIYLKDRVLVTTGKYYLYNSQEEISGIDGCIDFDLNIH